ALGRCPCDEAAVAVPIHADLSIAPGLLHDPPDHRASVLILSLERRHPPTVAADPYARRERHHAREAVSCRLDRIIMAARGDAVLEQRRQQTARAAGANQERDHLAASRSIDCDIVLDDVAPVLVERNEARRDRAEA